MYSLVSRMPDRLNQWPLYISMSRKVVDSCELDMVNWKPQEWVWTMPFSQCLSCQEEVGKGWGTFCAHGYAFHLVDCHGNRRCCP